MHQDLLSRRENLSVLFMCYCIYEFGIFIKSSVDSYDSICLFGSVWNCLWGNALKRSPGIICKSRVSYPFPGFLSSATWPSLPKKHYNGLHQTFFVEIG